VRGLPLGGCDCRVAWGFEVYNRVGRIADCKGQIGQSKGLGLFMGQ